MEHRRLGLRAILNGAVLLSISPVIALAAGVTGTVLTDSGSPLSGAEVTLHLRFPPMAKTLGAPPPASTVASYNVAATSGATGAYSFSNVPLGLLQVCVRMPDPQYLDPCFWKPNANVFESTGRDVSLPAIRVQRGYLFAISISDPQRFLPARDPAKPGSTLGEDIYVSIRTPVIGFLPLQSKAVPGGRRYDFWVPYDTPFPLNIEAPGLILADSARSRSLSRLSRMVTISRSRPAGFDFSITGRASEATGR